MIRKRIAVLGVALAALVLGLVGVAAPAAASGRYSYMQPTYQQGTGVRVGEVAVTEFFVPSARVGGDCAVFTFCTWTSTNYTGSKKQVSWPGDGVCVNYVSPYVDSADSSYNKTDFWWTIWEDVNGGGSRALSHSPQNCVCGGWGFPNHHVVGGWDNNIASSYCGGA